MILKEKHKILKNNKISGALVIISLDSLLADECATKKDYPKNWLQKNTKNIEE